nr:IclR family transcriptional regulator [Deinococcus aestuarii]
MKPGAHSVQSVENVGRLLELFTVESPEIGVTQAARHLGMSKGGAHALLTALTHIGLLHRFVTGRYRLGFRVMALNTVLMSHTPWRRVAREEMTRLAGVTGETVLLAAFDGGQTICIDRVEGGASPVDTPVGGTLPPHATAPGKVILAHRPPEEVEGLSGAGLLHRHTPGTITSEDELLSDLARTRERGYALCIEEHVPGVCGVAAPIRNANAEVIAAISLSVPTRRFTRRKDSLATHLTAAAAETSRRIGHDHRPDSEDGLYWHTLDGQATLRRVPKRRARG